MFDPVSIAIMMGISLAADQGIRYMSNTPARRQAKADIKDADSTLSGATQLNQSDRNLLDIEARQERQMAGAGMDELERLRTAGGETQASDVEAEYLNVLAQGARELGDKRLSLNEQRRIEAVGKRDQATAALDQMRQGSQQAAGQIIGGGLAVAGQSMADQAQLDRMAEVRALASEQWERERQKRGLASKLLGSNPPIPTLYSQPVRPK